jgi:hypothetical protein
MYNSGIEENAAMTIAEIMPAVQTLSRTEKFQLARLLIDGLAQEDSLGFVAGQTFPIYTPQFRPDAAAQLAKVIKEETP